MHDEKPHPPAPERHVLRATRAYLLPRDVRLGFEQVLEQACSLLTDAGMDALDDLPALALARGILADLEAALAAVDELETMVTGSSTSPEEANALAAARPVQKVLTPALHSLRDLQTTLRPHLSELRDAAGEEGG